VWLAKVAERGMFPPSRVHPEPIRRLRDFTRYRRSLAPRVIAGSKPGSKPKRSVFHPGAAGEEKIGGKP
jgi:hypothetical protein